MIGHIEAMIEPSHVGWDRMITIIIVRVHIIYIINAQIVVLVERLTTKTVVMPIHRPETA